MQEVKVRRGRRRAEDARSFSAPWIPKAPPGEHHDAACKGLGLRVSAKGTRSWFVRVQLADGRQVRRKLGEYAPASPSHMSLSDAREAADVKRRAAKDGTLGEARPDRPLTFGEMATKAMVFMAADTRARTIAERERILHRNLLPAWRHRPAKEISRADVAVLAKSVASKGTEPDPGKEGKGSAKRKRRPAPVMANRIISFARALFNAAIDLELVETNPIARPKRFMKRETPPTRSLKPAELKAIMAALGEEGPGARAFTGLALHTVQRAGAIAAARWDEFDEEAGVWTIPVAEGRKIKGYPRKIPLSPGALRALRILGEEIPRHPVYLFPSRPKAKTPHVGGSFHNNIVRRLRAASKMDGWSLHDLRTTFRTTMTSKRFGVTSEVADLCLSHDLATVGHKHYTDEKSEYLLDEKREALDRWAEFLEALAKG